MHERVLFILSARMVGAARAVGVVALITLLLPSYGAAQSTKYKKGDAVPLFANKVRPPPA